MRDYFMQLLVYNLDTGAFYWKVSRPKVVVGMRAGYRVKSGHRKIEIDGRSYAAHRLAWLFVKGAWPQGDLDHINRNPDDNRICNLRLATRSENVVNGKLRSDNSSGIKGVSWYKQTNRWVAQIRKKGYPPVKRYFAKKEDAIEFYKANSLKLHGEFAL